MTDYRLASLAETDLATIADHTIETFGLEQARRCREPFEACFRKDNKRRFGELPSTTAGTRYGRGVT